MVLRSIGLNPSKKELQGLIKEADVDGKHLLLLLIVNIGLHLVCNCKQGCLLFEPGDNPSLPLLLASMKNPVNKGACYVGQKRPG